MKPDSQSVGAARVLSVNVGSSSLKFGIYDAHGVAHRVGAFSGLQPGGMVQGECDGAPLAITDAARAGDNFAHALDQLVALIRADDAPLVAIAHRIVHGGGRFVAPCVLHEDALRELAQLNALAPLHQPHNLAGVAAFMRAFPDVPQIGCFDTAFHVDMPLVERMLPLPRHFFEEGIRRYGFHGLSYEFVSAALQKRSSRARGRCVLAHLGNGASVCATRDGKSVATSMGFSALDGLMMGTRTGSLDPGVLLYLLHQGYDAPRLETVLYKESGLLGVSALSADMRTLRASSEPAAREAIALFAHRLVREMGAMIALLGGVDLIAFTGGIGEHDHALRASVCHSLGFCGVALDHARNQSESAEVAMPLHATESRVDIWVVQTDEGSVAAQAAFRVVRKPE